MGSHPLTLCLPILDQGSGEHHHGTKHALIWIKDHSILPWPCPPQRAGGDSAADEGEAR